MLPQLSSLSLALCHEALEGGGYQQMGTSKYAKRNFPSCSLRSQFTAEEPMPVGSFSTVFPSFAFHISLYSFPFFDFRFLLSRGVKTHICSVIYSFPIFSLGGTRTVFPSFGFNTVFPSFAFHISLYSFPFFDFRFLLFRGVKPQIGKTVLVPPNFENRFLLILCWYPHVLYYYLNQTGSMNYHSSSSCKSKIL